MPKFQRTKINNGLALARARSLTKTEEKIWNLIENNGGSNFANIRVIQILEQGLVKGMSDEDYKEALQLLSFAYNREYGSQDGTKKVSSKS